MEKVNFFHNATSVGKTTEKRIATGREMRSSTEVLFIEFQYIGTIPFVEKSPQTPQKRQRFYLAFFLSLSFCASIIERTPRKKMSNCRKVRSE